MTSPSTDGRAPLLAGVGRGIGDTLALARASRAAGAGALMVHQPPDPFVAPRGVVAYVQRVADAAQGLPVVLHLRNDDNGLDAIEQLCRVPGIAGVKWVSPTSLRLAEAIRASSGSTAWRGPGLRRFAPSVEIWFQDEARVGQKGWIPY